MFPCGDFGTSSSSPKLPEILNEDKLLQIILTMKKKIGKTNLNLSGLIGAKRENLLMFCFRRCLITLGHRETNSNNRLIMTSKMNLNLLHKCLCRQTWNGSHREILIGKRCQFKQDFMVAKKLLNL
jgi:hypothetical protein